MKTYCLNKVTANTINEEIKAHPAWMGQISGLKAEKLLRGQKRPYLFILRAGELEGELESDYYVTFVKPDFSIMHQPFIISKNEEGWSFENGTGGGPYDNKISIDDVLHLIMHCSKDAATPFIL